MIVKTEIKTIIPRTLILKIVCQKPMLKIIRYKVIQTVKTKFGQMESLDEESDVSGDVESALLT